MEKKPEKQRLNSFLIAVIFLFSGISLFLISLFVSLQVISLIGLGLIFWGALFLLIPPPKHVEASYLVTSSLSNYMTIDRMLNYLTPKNEAYNIPPCPRDIFLPEHLAGLKEMVTFIPAVHTDGIAEIEDIAKGSFLIEKPKGILITSPGVGLLEKIEQKRKIDFAKIAPEKLNDTLANLLSELYLANEIEITINQNNVVLKINGSLYNSLYNPNNNLKSVNMIGCPLVNAAACAIAKSTGKPTSLQEIKTSPNSNTIIATLKITDRTFEKRQKLIGDIGKSVLRGKELLEVINASMGIIDLLFDILIGLHKKNVNWHRFEDYSQDFGETFSFIGNSLPTINLNLSKVSFAIKNQAPKETSEEVYSILKAIYQYFDGLNVDDDIRESTPNFISAKAIILSYYTLSDLLLGKVVKDKENAKKSQQLESILQILNNSQFKIDIQALKVSINKAVPEDELENDIENNRQLFKQQFKNMGLLNSLEKNEEL
jgi:hypothetical protein